MVRKKIGVFFNFHILSIYNYGTTISLYLLLKIGSIIYIYFFSFLVFLVLIYSMIFNSNLQSPNTENGPTKI